MFVWGWLVTLYLFLGGLSAGLFAATAGLDFVGGKRFKRTVEWGAYWSWVIIALGICMLILDLGRPERAFNTMIHPHPVSPMSWGSVVIVIFMVLALAYWLAHTGVIVKRVLKPLWNLLVRLKRIIGILGGMFAFMTGAYTGILLTYARHTMWASAALPALFLASALATGYALFSVIVERTGEVHGTGLAAKIPMYEAVLGVLELAAAGAYVALLPAEARAALLSASNPYSLIFLLIFLLAGVIFGEIVLPLLEVKTGGSATLFLSAFLTLLGGLALRYVIVFLGQSI